MSNIIQIIPFMVVDDVDEAVRFFVDGLGFTALYHRTGEFAHVQRETAAVRILKASDSPGEHPGPGTRSVRYYIEVKDVDAIVAEVKPRLETAWVGRRLHGPVDQVHGMREFMIESPDGDLVVFGQEIFDR
jgi:catechol 2,3-dioxygenase-like lactoylglutathione lyase family enzyme